MAEEFVTEEELVNGDPELSGTSYDYDEMLDLIMGNEFMRRPDVQSGWTTTEDGQAITNYEAMSNEERKAAWDEWYSAATEYGVENLGGSELMAYVATGYRLGYLTAEEADEYYDQAWSEMSAANGWELQDDGVTWRKETEGGGGRTIVETRTQPSFADGDFGGSGAWDGNIGESLGPGVWTDYDLNPLLSQESYTRVVEDATGLQGLVSTVLSEIMPVAVTATLTWATGKALGPLLTKALVGAGVPSAAASSIAAGIASQATNVLINGEFDITSALLAGAGQYLSTLEINEILGEAEGAFTEITEQVDKFQELISTGNSIADAAIQAGGVNMLAQFALTGDVDMTQALAAAIGAGGKQALDEFALNANLTEDELEQFFAEDDELQQAAIDADIKDPFLNPNYSTVGDGLMVDTNGNVFNYDGENIGTMDELDLNNDGQLTGADLQEITVDAQPIGTPSTAIEEGVRYYKDQNGNLVAQGDITGLKVDRDTGNYIDTDGNVYIYAGQGNAAGEVFDSNNGILTAADGTVLAVYDPDVGWVDTEGNFVGGEKEAYLNFLSSGSTSGNTQGFDMTREQYDNMSGQELIDDLWMQRGHDGQLALTKQELSAVMQRFGSVEAFEQYMMEQGIGVNVLGDDVVLVGGALDGSEEGVWNIQDGTTPIELWEEAGDASSVFLDPNSVDSPDIYDEPDSPFQEDGDDTNSSDTQETDANDQNTDTQVEEQGGGGATNELGGSGGSGDAGDNDSTVDPEGGSDSSSSFPGFNVDGNDSSTPNDGGDNGTNGDNSTEDAGGDDGGSNVITDDVDDTDGTVSQPVFNTDRVNQLSGLLNQFAGSVIGSGAAGGGSNGNTTGGNATAGGATNGTNGGGATGGVTGGGGSNGGNTNFGGDSTDAGGAVDNGSNAGADDGSNNNSTGPDAGLDNGVGGGQGGGAGGGQGLDSGGGGGAGGGGTGDGGMLTQQTPFQMPDFKPLYTTIEYTTPTIQPIIVDNRKDYVRELDALIDRGLFTSQKGIA